MTTTLAHRRAQAAYAAREFEADPAGWRAKRRAKQSGLRRAHPEKKSAWNKVYKAVKSGQLVRPDRCQNCLAECKPEASHDDYSKPLEVEWLCKLCHAEKDNPPRNKEH